MGSKSGSVNSHRLSMEARHAGRAAPGAWACSAPAGTRSSGQLGDAPVAIVAGVVAGLLLASIGSDLLAQFPFRIAARSPVAYGGVALLVVAAAAWSPMRRFSRVPLAQMLRQD
jgi:hypothetical protein